jgi:protein-disulfide isomerase
MIGSILNGVSAVAMTAASLAIIWTTLSGGSSRSAARPGQPVETVSGLTLKLDPNQIVNKRARAVFVEFTDYECPFCAKYAVQTYPEVKRDFVDRGLLEYVTRNFPLEAIHRSARKASEAAECAREQGQYEAMRTILFSKQQTLAQLDFTDQARGLTLDLQKFGKCLDGELSARIKAEQSEAKALGVSTTPTFMIGRVQADGSVSLMKRVTGAVPYDTLKQVLDGIVRSN